MTELIDSPEARLILEVTSPKRDLGFVRRALSVTRDFDRAFEFADTNRVLHQFAAVLKVGDFVSELPARYAERLVSLTRQTALLDRLRVGLLEEIIDEFRRADVEFILLKGLGLAETLYEHPFERVSCDIDILTRPGDLQAAERLLEALGYAPCNKDFYVKNHFHLPFSRNNATDPTVELHWQVSKPGSDVRHDVDDWWARTREVRLRSGVVRLPPATDEFMYICHHAFSKGSITVRDLADISRLFMTSGLDFEELIERSDSTGVTSFVRESLRLGERLWGIDLGEIPPALPSSSIRTWLARNLLSPKTIFLSGNSTWWPFKRICYWSLLDPARSRLRDLVTNSLRGPWFPDEEVSNGGRNPTRAVLKLCSLMLATTMCLLPSRLFPARLRRSN